MPIFGPSEFTRKGSVWAHLRDMFTEAPLRAQMMLEERFAEFLRKAPVWVVSVVVNYYRVIRKSKAPLLMSLSIAANQHSLESHLRFAHDSVHSPGWNLYLTLFMNHPRFSMDLIEEAVIVGKGSLPFWYTGMYGERFMNTLAQRADLTAPVADALMRSGSPDVLRMLALNPSLTEEQRVIAALSDSTGNGDSMMKVLSIR